MALHCRLEFFIRPSVAKPALTSFRSYTATEMPAISSALPLIGRSGAVIFHYLR